jgi:hypothetical protein
MYDRQADHFSETKEERPPKNVIFKNARLFFDNPDFSCKKITGRAIKTERYTNWKFDSRCFGNRFAGGDFTLCQKVPQAAQRKTP